MAVPSAVLPNWGDGRGSSVDVFTTSVSTVSGFSGCRTDTTVSAATSLSLFETITNSNPLFGGTYTVTVTNARGWPVPAAAGVPVGAASAAGYAASLAIPDTAVSGTNQVCVTVTNPGGATVGQCCFTLTVQGGQLAVGQSPAGLSLSRPSPNPASGQTRIGFSLPAQGHVRISVYGVAGERVRTLLDADRGAGEGSVSWDARDDGGRTVRPGAYFYRLEFAGRTLTSRVVMIQ